VTDEEKEYKEMFKDEEIKELVRKEEIEQKKDLKILKMSQNTNSIEDPMKTTMKDLAKKNL
jgi:hypothetical protein